MQELRRRKWAIFPSGTSRRRARAVRYDAYKLSFPFESFDTLKKKKGRGIERIESNIEQLKTMGH